MDEFGEFLRKVGHERGVPPAGTAVAAGSTR